MDSRLYPRYDTSDLELAFRKAAAQGEAADIAFMHKHLANVNINASGASGMTALHQACKNGHLDAVNFLIANKADPALEDKKNKNAYLYANEAAINRDEILQSLALLNLGKAAYQKAISLFPRAPEEDKSARDFTLMAAEVEEQLTASMNGIAKQFKKIADQFAIPEDKQLKHDEVLRSLILNYFMDVYSIYHMMDISQKNKFQFGYCDFLGSAIFSALIKTGIKVERFQVFAEHGDHAFIVMNRTEGSDSRDPNTWGKNAYFINCTLEVPDDIYAVSQRPADSILNILWHMRKLKYVSNIFPDVQPLFIEEKIVLAHETQEALLAKIEAMITFRFGADFFINGIERNALPQKKL